MQKHLNTWCEATGMKENMNKREGLLLGRMRRFVLNAPKNIVPNWTRKTWHRIGLRFLTPMHSFGCFYDAFSQIDLANRPFIPTSSSMKPS